MKTRNRIIFILSLVFMVVLAACATGNQTETPATRTPRPATATPEPVVETTPEAVEMTPEAAETTPEAVEMTPEATAEVTSVVETAMASSDFTVLVQAVEAAGLVETLSAEGPFTVFAPTDAAFTALLETLGMSAEELLANTELLTGVLTYHVVAGSLNATDLTNNQTLTTLAGSDLTVTVDGATVMINDATVIMADVTASNGVIHVIDKVLLPAVLTEMATPPVDMPTVVEETPLAVVVEATPEMEMRPTIEATPEIEMTPEVGATEVPATTTGAVITNVCLVSDQGGIKDGNFNQLAYVGMQRAEQDFGLQTQIIESDDPADYEPNMETCIRNGANVIVSVGFTQTDAALSIATKYPNVYVIGVDQFLGELPNVVSLQFREDQAGFLVGVMAALVTRSNIIGGVYGRDVPAVVKFRNGFEQGARYINPNITVLGQYTDRFDAPTLGANIAEQFIGEGADVIFGAGGGTGTGGIQYAAERGVYVIGVDQDEYLTNFGAGESPGAEFIISSALKAVDVGVYDMLAALAGDESKTFLGGQTYMLEAANNGIGFAPRHDSDISDEVVARVQQVFDMLKSGELDTGVDPITGALLNPPTIEATPEIEMTPEVEATEVPATTTGAVITNVCLVSDQGGIKDGNFNQLAYVGMQRAEQDFGLQTQIIESDDPADYEPNMETCIRNGANVIVSVGFTQTDAALSIATKYPNVYVIGVDQFLGELPNVVSLQFREDQAGFLVGVMAALVTRSNIIGGVYGRDVPAVVKFRNGFEQGARYINPNITVLGQYTDRFDAPTLGANIAEQFIGEGADVIFGAGGGTGTGGIQYAAERGVYVIGVDQDEYLTNFGAGESPGAEFIISSALKAVDVGVYDMLAALAGDESKTFLGGQTYMLEAANNGIGFAPRHDSDISDEVVARVQQVFDMLKSGELDTGVDPITGALLNPPTIEATPEIEMTPEVEATEVPATTTGAVITNVCLVSDQGGIKDGNFNQLAYVGMQRAEQDFGLQTQIIESDDPADYEPNMETCIRNGANVIVSVGFTQTDAALSIATKYPNVYVIGVDQFLGELPNVVSLQFREDQAGFLVGVMAALVTRSNIIGGVYGRDVPAVVKFRNGFEQGARYINPNITVLGQYTDRFDAPTLGANIAEQFIGEGADVIFGAGGGTGTGGIQYAAERGVYVIGVDQDEYLTNFGAGESPGAEFIISSALKAVDVGVYDMLAALAGDESKTFLGGQTYMLEAANNGIGFAPRHDSDISDEVVARVQQVFDMLKSGELDTGVDPITGALLNPPTIEATPEIEMTPEVEATPSS